MEYKNSRRELCRNAELLAVFTQKDFLKVKTAYSIDKVKFEAVSQGTAGKEKLEAYVKLDEFYELCVDIRNGIFMKMIRSEQATGNQKFPCSFHALSGEGGSREIKMSKAQKGDVNIFIRNDKKYKNIPVTFYELRAMARWFFLSVEPWENELQIMLLDAIDRQKEHFRTDPETAAPAPAMPVAEALTLILKTELTPLQSGDYMVKTEKYREGGEVSILFPAAVANGSEWERIAAFKPTKEVPKIGIHVVAVPKQTKKGLYYTVQEIQR